MITQKSKPFAQRFVSVLELCRPFLRRVGIDVDVQIEAARSGRAETIARELISKLEADDVHLPPGYWSALLKLKLETDSKDSK